MIAVIPGFVTGPFTNETAFKGACMRQLKFLDRDSTWVCIETEETEPGMPDTIRITGEAALVEYKVSDKRGYIKFKPSQPLWYRQHPFLRMYVLAWDSVMERVLLIDPSTITKAATLRFKLPAIADALVEPQRLKEL